jgi:hypothetical protein
VRRALALTALCLLLAAAFVAGCGSATPVKPRRTGGGIPASLLAGERPIGRGPRFQPPVSGPVGGACTTPLGRRLQGHIELFGANRVVLLATGIGTGRPRRISDGRLTRAGCFGDLVTLDPTGTVYFRPGRTLTLGDLFSAWGEPLTRRRIASFTGGRVRVYVDGHRSSVSPRAVPLTRDTEIVLEVGPHVPPHTHFTFPPQPRTELR